MGSVASTGKNNDELIDNLVEHDSIKNERVERIMRLVDRGKFMPLDEVLKHAYSDSAWKSDTGDPGFLHISAPCIYTNVLENLDVQKGMSFLNIGSGTGYLSTIIGFFLGENGVNHGVELYENVVNFANERIPLFQSSEEACVFDWCSPTYFIGNAFQIQDHMKYDRIYCGALVPECQRSYFCSFLKVDGILIMPYGHSLQRIIRKSEKLFSTRDLSAVTFSHLIPVNSDKNSFSNRPVSLPQYEPKSLQFICRNKIRCLIRQNLRLTQQVEIYSLCAEKLIKDGKNQRSRPARSYGASYSLVQDRLNPVVILQRGGTGHFLTSRTTLPLDPRNEDPDIPPPNNVQGNNRTEHFRHLFALFTRDRIHRHHEAIARRAADYGENVTDVSDSDSEEGGNGQRRRGRGNNNNNERQQQQNYVHGPVNDVYNFVFETEPDDDEQEELDNDNFSTIPFGGDDNEEEEEDEAELLTINYVDNEEDENEGEQSIIDGYPIALNKNSSLTNSNNNSTIDLTKQQEKYEDDSNESFKTANDNLDSSMDEEIKKEESSPKNKILKNGWSSINNNKRLRTFTYNSMEMPQSSKIKRRSSNSVENEGEGQSTSCSNNLNKLFNNSNEEEEKTNIKTNNNKSRKIITKRKLKNNKDSCCCSSTKANEDDEEVDMEEKEEEEEENKKNNKTKAEDKDQQLSTFYKLFVKLIETLPLNTKMRKFIIYEDE